MNTQLVNDSIRISLLTCGPGEEIYSLFGHTAVRVVRPARNLDAVFNYGVFSFNTPNFIMRFVLGETDYQLGVNSYRTFVNQYQFYNREVWEQELNLTQTEKEKIVNFLFVNYQPENRIYRYNFFYDNCSTRAMNCIERNLSQPLIFAKPMNQHTEHSFRDYLHLYSEGHPWSRIGMDLLLGVDADQPITRRETTFAPYQLKDIFDHAKIKNQEGRLEPFVKNSTLVIQHIPADVDKETLPTPVIVGWTLFIMMAILTSWGVWKQKSLWGVDALLFSIAGIFGIVLSFLALFSQHPAVSSNYQIICFHPFHLFCLPFFIFKVAKQKRSYYMLINFLILTFFSTFWCLIPQKIDAAVLPLALCLLIRSVSNLLLSRKKK